MGLKAKAMLEMSTPTYRSKTEAAWAQLGAIILVDELQLSVAVELYEALTFHVPGGKYTPDFDYILEDGTIALVEVKGSYKLPSYRDARAKLRACAELFPWFFWFMATKEGRGWKLERMNAHPG